MAHKNKMVMLLTCDLGYYYTQLYCNRRFDLDKTSLLTSKFVNTISCLFPNLNQRQKHNSTTNVQHTYCKLGLFNATRMPTVTSFAVDAKYESNI